MFDNIIDILRIICRNRFLPYSQITTSPKRSIEHWSHCICTTSSSWDEPRNRSHDEREFYSTGKAATMRTMLSGCSSSSCIEIKLNSVLHPDSNSRTGSDGLTHRLALESHKIDLTAVRGLTDLRILFVSGVTSFGQPYAFVGFGSADSFHVIGRVYGVTFAAGAGNKDLPARFVCRRLPCTLGSCSSARVKIILAYDLTVK